MQNGLATLNGSLLVYNCVNGCASPFKAISGREYPFKDGVYINCVFRLTLVLLCPVYIDRFYYIILLGR